MRLPLWTWLALLASYVGAVSLFNGSESLVLPAWTPSSCAASFKTAIDCDPVLVQLLTAPDDLVGWSTTQLQMLCTSACNSSLTTLRSQVASACGTQSFYYGTSGNLTFTELIDLRQFKYNVVCMQDQSSKAFCLDQEKIWNISALVAAGTVKWPSNTNKLYPDFTSDEGANLAFVNGSSLPLSWIVPAIIYSGSDFQNNASYQGNPAGQDWYVNRTSSNYSNYGWPYPLNYDEYPTQIQCSNCFLQKLQYGISSQYGNTYDEVMSQVWSNIQKNCKITTTLQPARNLTGVNVTDYVPPTYYRSLNGTSACTRYLTPSDPTQNASSFANANNVALMSILEMNNIDNRPVGSLPLCAPAACQIQVSNAYQNARMFVAGISSITYYQFLTWNPYVDPHELVPGEAVCVGPPGGAYQPAMATAANATVYSTTATPAAPTISGTIPYC